MNKSELFAISRVLIIYLDELQTEVDVPENTGFVRHKRRTALWGRDYVDLSKQ